LKEIEDFEGLTQDPGTIEKVVSDPVSVVPEKEIPVARPTSSEMITPELESEKPSSTCIISLPDDKTPSRSIAEEDPQQHESMITYGPQPLITEASPLVEETRQEIVGGDDAKHHDAKTAALQKTVNPEGEGEGEGEGEYANGENDVSMVAHTPTERITVKTVDSDTARFRKRPVVPAQEFLQPVLIPETPVKEVVVDNPRRKKRAQKKDKLSNVADSGDGLMLKETITARSSSNKMDIEDDFSPSRSTIPLGMARRGRPSGDAASQAIPDLESSQELRLEHDRTKKELSASDITDNNEGEYDDDHLGELPVVEIPLSPSDPRILSKQEFLSVLQMLVGNIHLVEGLSRSQLLGAREKLSILNAEVAAAKKTRKTK
jgi:hypothetical protein